MTEEEAADWEAVREAYEAGTSYRGCAELVGDRINYARIRRRALREGWVQGELPSTAGTEEARAMTAKARAAMGRKYAERKGELIDRLVEDAFELSGQLFRPYTVKEAKVVPMGEGRSAVEVAAVPLDRPAPADQQKIVTSVAILVDKLQLLTGDATSRSETGPIADRSLLEERTRQIRDELAERRRAAEVAADGAQAGG